MCLYLFLDLLVLLVLLLLRLLLLLSSYDLFGLCCPGVGLAVEPSLDVEVTDVLQGAVAGGADEALGVEGLARDLHEDAAEMRRESKCTGNLLFCASFCENIVHIQRRPIVVPILTNVFV